MVEEEQELELNKVDGEALKRGSFFAPADFGALLAAAMRAIRL